MLAWLSGLFSISADEYMIHPYILPGALGAGLLLYLLFPSKEKRARKRIRKLSENSLELTPGEFFALREEKDGRILLADEMSYAGVYILQNRTKRKYYVGQGSRVMDRIFQHFSGYGNGNVYADYVHGDLFLIRTIALEGSGYRDLDDLERDTILAYRAYEKGYNRTRGNGR